MLYDAPHYVQETEADAKNKRKTPPAGKKKSRIAEMFQSRLSDYK